MLATETSELGDGIGIPNRTLARLWRIAIGQCRRGNRPVLKLGGFRAISDGASAEARWCRAGFGPRAVAAIGFKIVQVGRICFR